MSHIKDADAKPEKLTADLDAGREWMRRAWQELNAIRARDGAPQGVSHEWWDEMTEALGSLLADDRVPWMTGAARRLIAPYQAERDASRAETEAVRADLGAMGLVVEQQDRDLATLRTLAAELVEGLRRLAQEAELDGLAAKAGWDCWVANAQALLSRARALGVGGEKEKNDG